MSPTCFQCTLLLSTSDKPKHIRHLRSNQNHRIPSIKSVIMKISAKSIRISHGPYMKCQIRSLAPAWLGAVIRASVDRTYLHTRPAAQLIERWERVMLDVMGRVMPSPSRSAPVTHQTSEVWQQPRIGASRRAGAVHTPGPTGIRL